VFNRTIATVTRRVVGVFGAFFVRFSLQSPSSPSPLPIDHMFQVLDGTFPLVLNFDSASDIYR
jgi:hypothetical protein